jgi:hypothetical protein
VWISRQEGRKMKEGTKEGRKGGKEKVGEDRRCLLFQIAGGGGSGGSARWCGNDECVLVIQ